MLKIGIVGAGLVSGEHVMAIEQRSDCRLAAVADVIAERAEAIAAKCGANAYSDYRKMCADETLDAVIINLPHELHKESTVFFLENNVNVLIEKPMANTVQQCREMLEAEKNSKAKMAVGHVSRNYTAIRKVKELVESGRYGRLCMINEIRNGEYFTDNRPKWFLDKKAAGGGVIMNWGAHTLDKLFYVTNSDIMQVYSNFGNHLTDDSVEGEAHILIRLSNDVTASITLCGYNVPNTNELDFYFTDGQAKIVDEELWLSENGTLVKQNTEGVSDLFGIQLDEFIKYISGRKSEIVTGETGMKIIAAIESIYKSRR